MTARWNDPLGLGPTGQLAWGGLAHVVADWILQTDHQANRKMLRRADGSPVWDRDPAAYRHAGTHLVALAPVFGAAAVPLAAAHLLIDTRVPVAWLAERVGHAPAEMVAVEEPHGPFRVADAVGGAQRVEQVTRRRYAVDVGTLVRFNVDQTWHLACVGLAAGLGALRR